MRNKDKNERNIEETKFLKSARWRRLRKQIIERDGSHCQRCLIKYNVITTDSLQGHHIRSRLNYPELRWESSNLICLCQLCNTQLGTKDKLDFIWEVPNEREPVL